MHLGKRLITAGCLLVLASATQTASGQCQLAKRTPTDLNAGDRFGSSVFVSGDIGVVGAYRDTVGGVTGGSAAVFLRDQGGPNQWGQLAKLVSSDLAPYDQFGYAVAVDGDYAVVGAYADDDGGSSAGSAYVFERNAGGADNWGQVAKLTASDRNKGDRFGRAVGISGDVIVIGAYQNDDNSANSGSAYIFVNSGGTWSEVKKLLATDAAKADNFGYSVAIDGDFAVVGAHLNDDGGSSAGSAYVFGRDHGGSSAWGEVAKLTASDPVANDQFGASVAISGGTVAVGALYAGGQGAVYVFDRDEGGSDAWGQVVKLAAGDAAVGDIFGTSVQISGGVLLVGAVGDDDGGSNSGSAYVFTVDEFDVWGEREKLIPSDLQAIDFFGVSVGVDGDAVFVGASAADEAGSNSGSAYVFLQDEGGQDAWGELAELTPTDGAGDRFGYAASIDGEFAVVGSKLDDLAGVDSGSAYVFQRDKGGLDVWGELAQVVGADTAPGDEFGTSVSVSGDLMIAGAPHHASGGTDAGSAYLFARNQGGTNMWGQFKKLTPSDGAPGDLFGTAVAIDGDFALVGAPNHSAILSEAGAAYLFGRNQGGADNWGEITKLNAADAGPYHRFGVAVDVRGDLIIVGADGYDDPAPAAGTAYVFDRNSPGPDAWGQVARLSGSTLAYDQFGFAVAIEDGLAVVGAPFNDDDGSDAGAAWVFERDEVGVWAAVARLIVADPTATAHFGFAVAIDAQVAVVGANLESSAVSEAGAAYVFEQNQDGPDLWGQTVKLGAADPAPTACFGASVSLSDGRLVIGADLDEEAGPQAGAAYVMDLGGEDCNLNGICDPIDILSGTSMDQNANGLPDECECLSDLNHDGEVGYLDYIIMLNDMGPCEGCPADRNFDGVVDFDDVLILLGEWGPC